MTKGPKTPMLAALPGYLAAFLALLMALCLAGFAPQVLAGERLLLDLPWVPELGIGLSFMLDGLALLFGLLITGIGALIFLYSCGYMGDDPRFGRFVLFLFCFMLSMLGLVLARDLITLFVFWELTSLTSYLLIGFDHESAKARRNALQALLVTGAGGLALLAGFILIGMAAGSTDLAEILRGPGLQTHALYLPILILVLLGAFTKSAQFPFHFWLPGAMAAPTPVSAYLHSATMVKAGVYLLARLHPLLSGTSAWVLALASAGLITTVLAASVALRQSDLKQALAWTTLMALGMITLFLAGDSPYALTAALTFLVVHSLYKAALFMVVGAVDHATGTREVALLGGLRRTMPLTALTAGLAGLSMAGLPPALGWIGKELLYVGAPDLPQPWLVTAGAVLANALIFAVAGIVALRPFHGQSGTPPHPPHEVGWQMLLGPLALGGLGMIFGLMPALIQPLITLAVTQGLGATKAAGLHLWAGVNLPLLLSLMTFALGSAIYLVRATVADRLEQIADRLPRFDPGWDRFLQAFRAFTGSLTRRLQNGRLGDYLSVTFAALAVLLIYALIRVRPLIALQFDAPPVWWIITAFTLAGAALALTIRSRIAVVAGVGAVGVGVALIFILSGAPDVATTQLMVETLAAILFAVALLRLPALSERRSLSRKTLHALIAGACGIGMTLIVLAIASHPLDRRLTTFFEHHAYTEAHGLNIVNVILVDFRAFDTFGELTVVLLAGVGAFALLGRARAKRGRR